MTQLPSSNNRVIGPDSMGPDFMGSRFMGSRFMSSSLDLYGGRVRCQMSRVKSQESRVKRYKVGK
jgi:hypothetical protein